MKYTLPTVLFLLLAGISNIAKADSPSFSYVEFEYVANGDFKISDGELSVDVGTDGFALNASLELGIFFIQAGRFELESDEVLDSRFEDNISTLALGMTFELPRTQIYGLIRGRNDELSLRSPLVDDEDEDLSSVGFEAGARINVTDRFELNANIGTPGLDEGTSIGAGAQFFITDNLGLTLNFRSIEVEEDNIEAEFTTTSLGLRFSF